MLYALGISKAPLLHLTGRAATRALLDQAGVRVRLNVENVAPTVLVDVPKMRRVGVERVFDQADFQPGIARAQPCQQALRGVSFAIILARAVRFEERFEVEREDFFVRRMDQRCRESGVVIRRCPCVQRAR